MFIKALRNTIGGDFRKTLGEASLLRIGQFLRNARNCGQRTPAGGVSTGPSGLNLRTSAVRSSGRSHRFYRRAAHRSSAPASSLPGAFAVRLHPRPWPVWPAALAGVSRSAPLAE